MVSIVKRRAFLAWLGLSLGAVTFSKISVTRIPPRVLQALKKLLTLGDGLKCKFEYKFN
jgi:hypothetical protein